MLLSIAAAFSTLRDVMQITNAKPLQNSVWYREQPNVIVRQLDFCYIFTLK